MFEISKKLPEIMSAHNHKIRMKQMLFNCYLADVGSIYATRWWRFRLVCGNNNSVRSFIENVSSNSKILGPNWQIDKIKLKRFHQTTQQTTRLRNNQINMTITTPEKRLILIRSPRAIKPLTNRPLSVIHTSEIDIARTTKQVSETGTRNKS